MARNISVTSSRCSTTELIDWLKIEFLDSGLIDKIQKRREKRNNVIHDLAKQNTDYSDLEVLATEGKDYFRKYTSLIMFLKKMI